MKYLFIICQLIIGVTAVGQRELYNPLHFKSGHISLGVGRDGCLALTTSVGEVGLAGSITDEWRRADIGAINVDDMFKSLALETPSFFNKDTGFVSGFIKSDQGRRDIIFHTTNGGKKWQPVKYGLEDGSVDDAVNNDNGEAWLSVAYRGLSYTADYGFSWKQFKFPEKREEHYKHIYFNTNRQGIIGSLNNTIYYTPDNCTSWKKIPTPLDQAKYNKTDRTSKPEITRVAIYKDYFLVAQEGLVFYSKRDNADWVWLPDYTDLFTDADNSALFFKTKKDTYVRADNNFTPVYNFDINWYSYDAKCKNGSLFIVCHEKMVQLTPENVVISTLYKGKIPFVKEPVFIGNRAGNREIEVLDNRVFEKENYKGTSKYLFTLPLSLDSNSVLRIEKENILLHKGDDSLFYFSFTGKLLRKASKRTMLANFRRTGIKQIVFIQTRGMHLFYEDAKLLYVNKGNEFVLAAKLSDTAKMPGNKDRISVKELEDFIDRLPAIYNSTRMTTIEDLGFSECDYEQCRKDILEFQASLSKKKKEETSFTFNQNNLDFNRLLNLVDSIKHVDTNMVNACLMYTDWWMENKMHYTIRIEVLNNNNEVLEIAGTNSKPDAFYFPWRINLNGYSIGTTDIAINRFIEKIYPSLLDTSGKASVLHKFVKALYR